MAGEAFQRFADELLGVADDYVKSGGIRVGIKTNLGPEITVATSSVVSSGGSQGSGSAGSSRSEGLLGLLGVRAAVIVRDRKGNRLATYGDVPDTEMWRVAVFVGAAALLTFLMMRGILKR